MKRIAIAAALLLALAGCAATEPATEPAPAADEVPTEIASVSAETEAAYVQIMAEALPAGMDTPANRDALLSFGYSLCENAAEAGTTTGLAATEYIDSLDPEAEGWMLDMGLALLAGGHSGEMLCTDYVTAD